MIEILGVHHDVLQSHYFSAFANAVGSSEIAANAVGSSEIAANAVGSSEIENGAIQSKHLDSSLEKRISKYVRNHCRFEFWAGSGCFGWGNQPCVKGNGGGAKFNSSGSR